MRLARWHAIRLVAACLVCSPAQAAEPAMSSWPVVAVGVFAHDQGPASDHHEHGVDLNLEVQFAPLDWWGSPRPQLGATLNFAGYTSAAYAGFDISLYRISNWFLDASISAAIHNGPLHKDPVGCQLESDCGYGSRVLPHFGGEFGYRLDKQSAVSLYYDHMSHKWIISGENEGLDHTGLRYMRSF
jgi:lipid A 3-O-deacylase